MLRKSLRLFLLWILSSQGVVSSVVLHEYHSPQLLAPLTSYSSLAVTRAPFCLIFRTLALHMMHLSGNLFWATAIWMVLTKHFLQTT